MVMNRVVLPILRGAASGKYKAKVESNGNSLTVGTFIDEIDAEIFLHSKDDAYFIDQMKRKKKLVKFDKETWKDQSKSQVLELSIRYMFMKSNLSAEQAKAIKRFCDEKEAVPQMSVFPTVRFKIKESGEIVEKHLSILVHEHKVATEEEQKTRADEKKRKERENKWKPITER
jgi:hypothetical protein